MANEGAQVRLRNKIDPPCPRHSDIEALFICHETGCNEALACQKCVIQGGFHCGHTFTLLHDLMDSYEKQVADFNQNTRRQVLRPFQQMSAQVDAELSAYEGTTSTLLKEIEKRGDKLHSHIDELVNEYKQKCRQLRSSKFQVLEQYKRDLLAKIAEVEKDIISFEECIQSKCKADIINAAKTGISKTYESIEYPTGVGVTFQQSEVPLQDMKRFMGSILIANEQPERQETDEDKIKRLESRIQELTQRQKRDEANINQMEYRNHELTKRQETDEDKIKRLESRIQELTQRQKRDEANINQMEYRNQELTKREQSALARIQTLQANNDELTRKLQDQKSLFYRDSERSVQKQKTPGAQGDLCSECGTQKETCQCETCPKCSYRGNDFLYIGDRFGMEGKPPLGLERWVWKCPKCGNWFSE